MLSPDIDTLQMLDTVAAFLTAVVAFIAMLVVGRQDWRQISDMRARQVCLAVLSIIAMYHARWPAHWPNVSGIAQQFVLVALLIVLVLGSRPARREADPATVSRGRARR